MTSAVSSSTAMWKMPLSYLSWRKCFRFFQRSDFASVALRPSRTMKARLF